MPGRIAGWDTNSQTIIRSLELLCIPEHYEIRGDGNCTITQGAKCPSCSIPDSSNDEKNHEVTCGCGMHYFVKNWLVNGLSSYEMSLKPVRYEVRPFGIWTEGSKCPNCNTPDSSTDKCDHNVTCKCGMFYRVIFRVENSVSPVRVAL